MKYIVKKGDTLSKISKTFTGSSGNYLKLADLNGIKNADLIYPGQEIEISDTLRHTAPSSPPPYIIEKTLKGVTVVGRNRKKYNKIKIPKTNYIEQNSSTKVERLPQRTKSIKELNTESEFMQDVKRTFRNNSIIQIPKIIKRGMLKVLGIEGDLQKSSGFNQNVSFEPDSLSTSYPSSFYGDTIRHTYLPVSDNQYLLPENINLDEVRLSGRNRGDYSEKVSLGLIIPTYREIEAYDDYIRNHSSTLHKDSEGHINKYIGFDKTGRFKLGTIDEFESGDSLTLTFYGLILNPIYDENGKLHLAKGFKDSRRLSPVFRGVNESGDTVDIKYPLMTPLKQNKQRTDMYDNVVGGAMLVECDGERRLIRGSIDDVVGQIENMRKRHKGKPINYYEVDNASYNRGLRTYGGVITAEDWKNYDALNNHAGHGMILK